ncbi:hypothetical protein R5R35_000557 [Gryllus longicercus]|uniref:Uncharacterized protein n=1 Tax=Gryllus longicercus TaxID=2509291 RepID=A0AAN9VY93_9ORTH
MVYHRSDNAASSADSRREADKSWSNRDSNADNASEPVRNSGESSRPDDSVDDSDPAKYPEELRPSGKYSDSYDGRHSNYEGRYSSSNHEVRYGDSARSRNGRDEGSRYSRNSRSRDDDRYSRSRDDRREGFRDKDRYDSPRYSERSRYRESSRHDRYEEGSRRSESSRYSERSRYNEDSEYGSDSRHNESSRHQDEPRHSESSRYSENSRYRSSRSEEWYNREGRYSSSRYDEDSRYGGESSRHWRDREQEMSPEDASTNAYSEPEQEKVRNVFQNDGSFLEMFKKMQEANKPPVSQEEGETTEAPSTASKDQPAAPESTASVPKRPPLSIVGKRRGGRVLPTGMVKKQKREEEVEETPKDAWSLYIAEVRKYKEASCEEEGKTRPLVK